MTMADQIAVMNKGVIEQMGAPEDLYENPETTFVANFLGQSNLIMSDVRPVAATTRSRQLPRREGRRPVRSRDHSPGERAWLGVRPEKIFVARNGDEARASNTLEGGVVSDVSFIGVSTQYLVRMAWGQELMVFEQNTGQRGRLSSGDRRRTRTGTRTTRSCSTPRRTRKRGSPRGRRMTTATDVPEGKGVAAEPPPRRRRQWGWLLVDTGPAVPRGVLPAADDPADRHQPLRPERLVRVRLRDDVALPELRSASPTTRTSSCGRSAMRPS